MGASKRCSAGSLVQARGLGASQIRGRGVTPGEVDVDVDAEKAGDDGGGRGERGGFGVLVGDRFAFSRVRVAVLYRTVYVCDYKYWGAPSSGRADVMSPFRRVGRRTVEAYSWRPIL